MCAISEFGLPVCDRCGGDLEPMDVDNTGAAFKVQRYEGMVCDHCGKMYCSECLAEMKMMENDICPECQFELIPLTSDNLPNRPTHTFLV